MSGDAFLGDDDGADIAIGFKKKLVDAGDTVIAGG